MSSEDQAHAGGCDAFGHLVSPWIDGELAGAEKERFEAHLPACRPCHVLGTEYRVLDAAARPAYPPVGDAAWDRTWSAVMEGVAGDREAAEHAPLAPLTRLAERIAGRRSQ